MKQLRLGLILGLMTFFFGLCNHTYAMQLSLEGMTREKAAVKIVEELGYEGVAKAYDTQVQPFSDVTSSKGAIYLVQQFGIMSGIGEGKFNPTGLITSEQSGAINERLQNMMQKALPWKHGFYAIQSNSQMDFMKHLDAVSFGWAQVEYDGGLNTAKIATTAQNAYGFRVPKGFQIPMDFAKVNNIETYIMVFFNDKDGIGKKILSNPTVTDKLIKEIVSLCNGLTQDGETRSFDGVTIDFEGFIDPSLAAPYNEFLRNLNKELEEYNKKLNVAIQPNRNFKGYDYKAIGEVADKVILMAHDYEPKKLSAFEKEIGRVYTPITPISEVYKDLSACIDGAIGVADKSKVVLQISFGSAQWQTKDGKVIHDYPYTPSYDKIEARIGQEGVQSGFDRELGNPFVTYTQDGISNMIWYENERSVQLKTQLIQLLNTGGISYWRLGTIPEYIK